MIVIASLAQLIDWGRQSDSMDLHKLTTRSSDSDSDSDKLRLTLLAGKTSFIVVVVVSTLYSLYSINILLFLIFFLTSCIHQSCILYLRSCMHSI